MNDVVGKVVGREKHDVSVGDLRVGGVLALCLGGSAGVRITRPTAGGIGGAMGDIGDIGGNGGVTGISRFSTPITPYTRPKHITN